MAWTQTADKAGKYTFTTAGKYVDRDIELTIPKGTIGAITGTAINGNGSATISSVSVGTKTSGKYPLTGSAAISGSTSGTATATGGTAGWIDSSTTNTGTVTGKISGTASLNYQMPAAAATVTGSATVKPNGLTAANGNATTAGSATTTQPTSGYYIAATPATAATTTITQNKSGLTAGYLGNLSEISASGSVTGGSGSKYYIPITPGSIESVSTDPGTGYAENTTAAISSGGYLKIEAGWIPKTKISLATLIGDDIDEVTVTTASSSMLNGFRAYDKDGNVLIGNIPTKTASNLSASGKTVTVPAGYYATNVSKSVADAGAATVKPTAVTTEVTIGSTAASGFYPVTNTVGAEAYHATAGWCAATSSSKETGSASIQVGKIAASTSDIAPGSTINLGGSVTVQPGYYPTARTWTAATATSGGTTTASAALALGAAPTDYVNPELVDSKTTGKTYIELQGQVTGYETGKVLSSVTTPVKKYLEVYTGTYTVA